MRLIFFSFKHRYRQKELNNFLNTRIYGKYFILNLGGPFKHFIAKILLFLRIGKAISCDGRPLIADKSRGINFWMRGTSLNIPSNLKNLNNNFVTINNSLFQEKKVFQIYPINIKKTQIQDDLKIIYVSRVNIETNLEEKYIWEKYKTQIIEDFSLIDNKKFFEKIFPDNNNDLKKFNLYKKLKLLLRFEIIKNIKARFDKKLNLIGDDWSSFSFNSLPSIYNIKKINVNIHNAFKNMIKESKEERSGEIFYSTHLLLKDGIIVAWLATNNNPHFFPFGGAGEEWFSSLPCISPYLKQNDPEAYEAAVKSLINILSIQLLRKVEQKD